MDDKLDESGALNIDKDLKISSIKFPKRAKDIISEDLNDDLSDHQLNQPTKENEFPLNDWITKETHCHQSQFNYSEPLEKNPNYESFCNTNLAFNSQIPNTKIIELSKKLGEKNAEIEVYKKLQVCKIGEFVLLEETEIDSDEG